MNLHRVAEDRNSTEDQFAQGDPAMRLLRIVLVLVNSSGGNPCNLELATRYFPPRLSHVG